MIFNVKDFGAVGDGITDDTAAIQAAIDAANAAGGGEVYLPEGTWIVSNDGDPAHGCLMMKSNVQLNGDGMGLTVVKVADGSDGKITGVIRSAYGEETHDFGVSNLTIDGNRDNTTGKIDGWFNGYAPDGTGQDSNVTLDSVEIKDCSGYGFDPHEQTVNMVIRNSVSHGNGLDGFVADYLSFSTFENNVAYDNDRHGFNIVTSTHDFTMTGNVAYDNGGGGIVVQRGSDDRPLTDNITITGGAVYGNALEGILIKLSTDVTVQDVEIYENGSAAIRIYGSSGVKILDNDIHDNAQNGPVPEIILQSYDDTQGVSGQYFDGRDNLIQGNTITGGANSTYGVAERNEDGTDHNLIYDNDISGTSKALTLIYGDGSVVSDTVPYTYLIGTDGKDTLLGTDGNDILIGGAGADKLTGGDGADIFRFTHISDSARDGSTSKADLITDFDVTQDKIDVAGLGFSGLGNGKDGTLQVAYNASTDRTYIKSLDADENGQRFEIGLSGNLVGKLTNDAFIFQHLLLGTSGDDIIVGSDANETIDGGAGRDVLSGGGGADVFQFSNLLDSYRNYGTIGTDQGDRILDFDATQDRIDVSALGFTGLGNGHDGTLLMLLNDRGDRTYFKSRDADSNGNQFEFSLSGDHTADVTAANFVFAEAAQTTAQAQVELVGLASLGTEQLAA